MNINTIKTQFMAQYALASQLTKDKYKNDIESFLNICGIKTIEELNALNETHIEKFNNYASTHNWNPNTINQRLGIAKLFTSWCFRKHFIENDGLEDVKRIRTVNMVHYAPDTNQTEELLNYIKEHTTKRRLYLMVKLISMTGLRRMEVCNLKVNDLDKQNSTIKILGKGKKIVEQPIPSSLVIELVEYINTERREVIEKYISLGGKDKGYMFLSGIGEKAKSTSKDLTNGNRVNDNVFYQQIKRYAKLSGLENADKITPHGFRRSAGTRIYEETGDLKTAQEFLRHSSITTTEKCYVDYNRDRIKQAVNNTFNSEEKVVEQEQANKLNEDEEYQLFLLLKKKFGGI